MNLLKEQYYLSKHGRFSFTDSDNMADFERDALLSFIQEDIQRQNKEMSKNKT